MAVKPSTRAGFTLVELAIVLVIIGLIIGGVLVGQSLIANAEIRAVIQERQNIEAAINTFRTKYNAIPGDMRNATTIWGAADPDPATCVTTRTDDGTTCNGNGNKRISSPFDWGNEWFENARMWQQLSNQGLIPASLNGYAGASSMAIETEIGVNTPGSKIDGAGWMLEWMGNVTPAIVASTLPYMFPGDYSHVIIIGIPKDITVPGTMPVGPIMETGEVMRLDQKMDDGLPGTGVMKAFAPGLTTPMENLCATTADPKTAEYNVQVGGIECTPVFKIRF